jgi:uncharacterized protein (DUF362 family)
MVSRRRFLELSGKGLLALPTLPALSAATSCATTPAATSSVSAAATTSATAAASTSTLLDRVHLGLFGRDDGSLESQIASVLSGLDFSWLSPGDSVMVKVASNSGELHPATTHPTAVSMMVKALLERGAGRVILGEQSGVASVRLIRDGRRVGSSRELMTKNGILGAAVEAGAEVCCFEEHGFHDGYVMARLPRGPHGMPSSWRRAPHIARAITEVDHIVYLPRLSAHTLSGYTHGHKIAIGFLRDDSRHLMHADGERLYEQYTEVNYCEEIRSRLRLTVTVADAVLLDGGPDGGLISLADPRMILASRNLANHDAVSVGLLGWAKANLHHTSLTAGLPFGAWASLTNAGFVSAVGTATGLPWTSDDAEGISLYPAHDFLKGGSADRCLAHAYALTGGVPDRIAVDVSGSAAAEDDIVAFVGKTVPLLV